MHEYLKVPAFESERDEAKWWYDNRERLADDFEAAAADGTLTRGRLLYKVGATPTTTIPLDPADISRARTFAEKKGIRYQTYLKTLIHEALEREEKAAS